MKNQKHIAVVIPCYNVQQHLAGVVASLPDFIDHIFLVNDCSTDNTATLMDTLSQNDGRITCLTHAHNKGVGGAMLTGFQTALQTDADIVVKLDGDGQMDTTYLADIVDKIEEADYVKGNRLFDRKALERMPTLRRIGNMGIGFMVKAASGYWDITDPVNGYFAITTKTLRRMDFDHIAPRYFFESSMLIELYYTGARIREISMPAIYADETSHLSISKTLFQFPPKLLKAWLRRLHLQYFIYDFNVCSLYLLVGVPSFLFGLIFGITQWIHYASMNCPSPTGTIMVAVLTFILGFQMLLAATQYDISSHNPFTNNE